jgi:hypothetical protein
MRTHTKKNIITRNVHKISNKKTLVSSYLDATNMAFIPTSYNIILVKSFGIKYIRRNKVGMRPYFEGNLEELEVGIRQR